NARAIRLRLGTDQHVFGWLKAEASKLIICAEIFFTKARCVGNAAAGVECRPNRGGADGLDFLFRHRLRALPKGQTFKIARSFRVDRGQPGFIASLTGLWRSAELSWRRGKALF